MLFLNRPRILEKSLAYVATGMDLEFPQMTAMAGQLWLQSCFSQPRTALDDSSLKMKISNMSRLTIIFGMVISQAGWLIAGIALLRVIYVDQWHFIPEDQVASLGILAGLSALFLGAGVAKGMAIARALEKEKIVRGRLLKVEEDNSGEDTKYRMAFAFTDNAGSQQVLRVERQRKDLTPGDEISVLIDEQTGEGLLELDLPGGMVFANFLGTQPINLKIYLRILTVPVLAFAPLLGLVPSVAATFQHLAAPTDTWLVCGWSVVVQVIWLFAHRRYFTFKATNIACGGAKHPPRPAGESP